jgi:hypothetical protein
MSARRFPPTSLIRRPSALCLGLLLLGVGSRLPAQAQAKVPPTVSFTFDFPGSEPEHFAISVASDGHSVYSSNGKLTAESEGGEPFHLEFQMSEPTRARIFDGAKRAHNFAGRIDSGKKVAFTGTKTLSYKDGQGNTQATYDYSPVPAVQELTALFQNLSATLEFGRRLEYYHRYQKLALDDELKKMEEMARNNDLAELQAVAPILRAIVEDPSVMTVVRARASRLLDRAGVASAP